jgi:carbonic anhydrase
MRVQRVALALALSLFAATLSAQLSPSLDAGNQRFQRGALLFAGLNELRTELVPDQHPEVTILSCADSRVPPELVFDQTLGDIFVVREAGNVADTFGLASLKYALTHHYTGTLVVLGHQNCGAVKLAMTDPATWPNDDDVRALLKRIRTAIGNEQDLATAIKINARASAKQVSTALGGAPTIAAYYDMSTGKVTRLSP